MPFSTSPFLLHGAVTPVFEHITEWKYLECGNSVQAESHILYQQRKGGDLMKYEFYINGVRRDRPTKEEAQILLDRLMEGLGYERINKDEDKGSDQKEMAVV